MPPFLIPVVQAIAASVAVDSLRQQIRRYVPPAAPPTFAQGGGRSRPPLAGAGRTSPLTRPAVRDDRRG